MKCYICESKDNKINMQKGKCNYKSINAILNIISFGVIPDKYNYFHRQCLEAVICDPEYYTKEQVERALECYDFILSQKVQKLKKLQEKERLDKVLKSRITLAQSTLKCKK